MCGATRPSAPIAAHGLYDGSRSARSFLAAYEHTSSDAHHNGEYDLLRRLATKDDAVVIDCGANVGTWISRTGNFAAVRRDAVGIRARVAGNGSIR